MKDINKIVKDGYKRIKDLGLDSGFMGKRREGVVTIQYASIWDDDVMEVSSVEIYSYELGPSRQHYFYKSQNGKEYTTDYNTWHCVDPVETAAKVFNGWVEDFIKENL